MKETIIIPDEQNSQRYGHWVSEHKKEIIVGTCLVVGTIVGVIIYKKVHRAGILVSLAQFEQTKSANLIAVHQALPDANVFATGSASQLDESSLSIINGGEAFDVSKHIRNLSGGRVASAAKVRTAFENGFELGPNQTWVEHYIKNRAA